MPTNSRIAYQFKKWYGTDKLVKNLAFSKKKGKDILFLSPKMKKLNSN